jgi:hypothetical protein
MTRKRRPHAHSAGPESSADAAPPSSGAIVALLALVACTGLVAGFWVKVVDADVLWHLRTGRLIWDSGAVPRTDPYSASAAGAEWVGQEWLWQAIAWRVYAAGGWAALSVARILAVATAGVFAMLAAREQKAGWPGVLLAAVTACALVMAIPELRPQIASLALFSATLFVLEMARREPRLVWALPFIFLPWTNLHGAYLNGFVLIGAYAVSDAWTLAQSRRRRDPVAHAQTRHRLIHIVAAGAFCVVAALVTPFGWKTLTYALRVITVPFFRERVYEWSPPGLSTPFLPFYSVLALAALALAAARGRLQARHWLVVAGFAAMALSARRQIPFFALAALPPLAIAIDELFIGQSPRARRVLHAVSPLLAALVLVSALWCYHGSRGPFGAGMAPGRFPEGAVAALERLSGGGVVLNDYNDGGFLIWQLWPDWKVTMDGRIDVYGPEVVRAYDRIWRGAPEWRELVEKWGVRVILGRYEITGASPQHNIYHELAGSPEWALVYWDERNILYARRGDTSATLALRPYEVVQPGIRWPELRKLLTTPAQWQALRRDLNRADAENPGDRRVAALRRYLEASENQGLTDGQAQRLDAQ